MRLLTFFVRYIKVMIGYLTSYIKESPFVLFQPYAHFILDRCGIRPQTGLRLQGIGSRV